MYIKARLLKMQNIILDRNRRIVMMHKLCIVFGLLLLPHTVTSSEKKEPTIEEKKQREADAEKWKRITTALSGKMGEKEDQTPTTVPSQFQESLHKQAKL